MTKKWMLILLILLIVVIGAWTFFNWWGQPNNLPPINKDYYKVVGIIDFANKQAGPDFQGVRDGIDPVLVVDHTQPYYGQLMAKNPETANDPTSDIFRLQIYDENNDGLLDNQDSIWSHLYILVFNPDTNSYVVRSLNSAGIRAILLKHLTARGNHTVILSNGEERTLYETTAWSKKPK